MSRRVLETLTYLARNHPYVANILLQFKLPRPLQQESENLDKARGKAVMILEDDVAKGNSQQEGYFAVALLLSLLKQPLYLRSIAHLEQVMIYAKLYFDCLVYLYNCLTWFCWFYFHLFRFLVPMSATAPIGGNH